MKIQLLCCATLFLTTTAFAEYDSANLTSTKEPVKVLSVTPSGATAGDVRQIVLKFNQAMVPVGRMERRVDEIPITITPKVACEWRWLNTNTLACQLTQTARLKLATQYKIQINPGLQASNKKRMTQAIAHEFTTQTAKVNYTGFSQWLGPGAPVVQVHFDQNVSINSARSKLFFKSGNLKVPALLQISKQDAEKRFHDVIAIKPTQSLPLGQEIHLMLEPGIISEQGPVVSDEKRVVVSFHTFPEFRLLGVHCKNLKQEPVKFNTLATSTNMQFNPRPGKTNVRCNPEHNIELQFSTPVDLKSFGQGVSLHPGTEKWKKFNAQFLTDTGSSYHDTHSHNRTYPVDFMDVISPYSDFKISIKSGVVKDQFGRVLNLKHHISFSTDHYAPKFNLEQITSVLEKSTQAQLNAVGININNVKLTYNTFTSLGVSQKHDTKIEAEKTIDQPQNIPIDINKLLGGKSGLVYATWKTDPTTPYQSNGITPDYNGFLTQVSPFQVHMKYGHYNSLAWVTRIDNGTPVKNARVSLWYKPMLPFIESQDALATATTNDQGIAKLPGTLKLDPELNFRNNSQLTGTVLQVRVEHEQDFAILPATPSFHLDQWRLGSGIPADAKQRFGHLSSWGFTPQGVYKLGEKVQYKIFVRDHGLKGLLAAPDVRFDLQVFDPLNKPVHEKKAIKLSGFGSFADEFKTETNSVSGWYRFELRAADIRHNSTPMRVLITDFRPAPFKVSNSLDKTLYTPGDDIKINTQANLHAGGPYADANTRITTQLQSIPFVSQQPAAKGFRFDNNDYAQQQINQTNNKVDKDGKFAHQYTLGEHSILYGNLSVESAIQDDRGKSIATSSSALYAARDRYIGLKHDEWLLKENTQASIQMLVADNRGAPVGNTAIDVNIEYERTELKQTKTEYGATLSEPVYTWEKASSCQASSAQLPVHCKFTPKQAGRYRITASIKDTKGRAHQTVFERWATGVGRVYWPTKNKHALEIVAENPSFKVHDKARFLIKNPFPGAQALVTVERYGIIDSWVKRLDHAIETLEVDVKPEYMPGFYLSVTLVSPKGPGYQTDKNSNEEEKTAIRFGYVKVPVSGAQKTLQVKISTDKNEYRPREMVRASFEVKTQEGKNVSTELAVAVLDEAVFDLIESGKLYYDAQSGFYKLHSLSLQNYNLLLQFIEKRRQRLSKNFLKKKMHRRLGEEMDDAKNMPAPVVAMETTTAAELGNVAEGAPAKKPEPEGAKTPQIALRSLFKNLSYWNASVTPDQEGKAKVEFQAPDNLTAWKILVIAVDKSEQMGLGEGRFQVNQPLEVRAELPNQVTQGDEFEARFSVMNRGKHTHTIQVNLTALGAIAAPKNRIESTQTITAEPFKRVMVGMPVAVNREGVVKFTVTASVDKDSDGVSVEVPVRKLKATEVAATYGTSTQASLTELFKIPANAQTDVGKMELKFSPSVIGNLEGAFRYLRDYPYACWEQKLTKGVMASHYQQLQPWLPKTLTWEQSKQLPQQLLEDAVKHQAPNGGMVFYIPEDRHVSPYLSAYTAIAFNWLRASGHTIPVNVEDKLHQYLLNLVRTHEYPTFFSDGMKSSVRAVALAALAERGKVTLADVKKDAPETAHMDLFGKSHYLRALSYFPQTQDLQKTVAQQIQASADETSGKYVYSEKVDAAYGHLLHSSVRSQCAILSGRLRYETQNKASDIPFKLVRAITQSRKTKNRWESTQDNMFCMNALIEYSRVYEKDKPDMEIKAFIEQNIMGKASLTDFRDEPKIFSKPLDKSDPGQTRTVKIEKQGTGRYYYSAQLHYSPLVPKPDAINSGIEVQREYHVERDGQWALLTSPMKIKQGELVRVDLYIDLPAARYFVVVDDPVPGGLEPVNTDLATASKVDDAKAKISYAKNAFWYRFSDWHEYGYSHFSFYHREILHHSVRYYSEYLAAGRYHLSYVAQAIAPGQYQVMPTHAEEMYEPDVFGKSVPGVLKVEGKK